MEAPLQRRRSPRGLRRITPGLVQRAATFQALTRQGLGQALLGLFPQCYGAARQDHFAHPSLHASQECSELLATLGGQLVPSCDILHTRLPPHGGSRGHASIRHLLLQLCQLLLQHRQLLDMLRTRLLQLLLRTLGGLSGVQKHFAGAQAAGGHTTDLPTPSVEDRGQTEKAPSPGSDFGGAPGQVSNALDFSSCGAQGRNRVEVHRLQFTAKSGCMACLLTQLSPCIEGRQLCQKGPLLCKSKSCTVPLPSHGPKLVPQHGQGRGASERGLLLLSFQLNLMTP
mmetsp:Transcript_62176/g.136148  ORF Transcript_62176/g.136148 Transcript_62176/m.136148 type:complete len:284 (+) Transcript_62176:513-1364(+)